MSLIKQISDSYGWSVECTPMDELRVAQPFRLVGTTFAGTTIDTNFWTATPTNSATIEQSHNQILLSSGTNTAGSAILTSVRNSRYLSGSSNRFRAVIMLGDTGVADNTRRWGIFNGTDGIYFELAGTTLSACTIKGGARTAHATLTSPTTNVFTCEIYMTNSKVYWVINGVLVHTYFALTDTYCDTLNLPVRVDNINSGSSTNSTISCRVISIYRLGEQITEPISKFFNGTSTAICKYSAGIIHSVINCDNVGSYSVYDGLTSGGILLFTVDTAKVLGGLNFDIPFYTGLFISSTNAKIVAVYE